MSFDLMLLMLLALLVLGPRKLPEIARTIARFTAELRRASNEFRYTLEEELRTIENDEQNRKRLPVAATPPPVTGAVAHVPEPAVMEPSAEITPETHAAVNSTGDAPAA